MRGAPLDAASRGDPHEPKEFEITHRTLLLLATSIAMAMPATVALAQDRDPAGPNPTQLADLPRVTAPVDDWRVSLGAALLHGPSFLGSNDYQLRAGPNVEVRYHDRLFLSVTDGVGFDILRTAHVRAGPLVKYQQTRNEDGGGMFVIAGGASDALRGLGDVPATAEAGGYLVYRSGHLTARVEVRKGIGGHDGTVMDLGVRYSGRLGQVTSAGQPMVFSVGPRATLVDGTYNRAYFGVDARQAATSGLAEFSARGGLQSYGAGGAIVLPMTSNLSAAVLASVDRLAGDAARAPLVRERGSRMQSTVGLALTYRFGL